MRLVHEKLEEIASDVGRVTILWSDLHYWVCCVFSSILGAGAWKGDTAFFALRSDRTQRELTKALVKAHMPPDDPLRGRILATLKDINELAARRNAIIHTIWDASPLPLTAYLSSGRKLSQKDVKAELSSLQSDIFELTKRLVRVVVDVTKRYEDQQENFLPLFELPPFKKAEEQPPDGA